MFNADMFAQFMEFAKAQSQQFSGGDNSILAQAPHTANAAIKASIDATSAGSHFCINVVSGKSKDLWIIYSGASDHMICDQSLFYNKSTSVSLLINLSNNNYTTATLVGDVKLSDNIMLYNVLFIPDFTYNLLSISHLAKHSSCRVIFDNDN